LSVATYAAALWALGGLDPEILALLRDVFQRKRGAPAGARAGTDA